MLIDCSGDLQTVVTDHFTENKVHTARYESPFGFGELITEKLIHPDSLGPIVPGMNKHYYSSGAFDLIQLILYVLSQTGPAHVFMSSYSISQDSISMLKKKSDSGDILSIRFLIDNRVRSISPKPFDFLVTSFSDSYRCCALHAKVALIWNERYHIDIVGSQNATHNPKLERGILHTDREIFDFDYNFLLDEYNRGAT